MAPTRAMLLLALLIGSACSFSVQVADYAGSTCSGSSLASTTVNINQCYSGVEYQSSDSSCSSGNTITIAIYSNSDCTGTPSTGTATIGECYDGGSSSALLSCSDCFPANATVELEQGTTKRMDELAVGDRVRTGPNTFSDVHFFSHDDADATSLFHILTTASGHQLVLTGQHYVHLMPDNALVQARNLRVGHVLQLANGTASPIVAITTERRNGLYNPHTLDGKIVVDGVLASCYTGTIEPTVAHALLWPLRALYSVGVRVFDSLPANEALRTAVINMLPQGK
jgi:hypothetical protein